MTKLNHERANRARLPRQHDAQALDLDSVLTFGKHKGRTVEDVLNDDAGWLKWAAENIGDFELDTAVLDAVMRAVG